MKVAILGCGRLGTVVALVASHGGHTVVAYDTNKSHLDNLKNRRQVFSEPGVNELLASVPEENLILTSDFNQALENSELAFIFVPTNTVGTQRGYDHGILGSILRQVNNSGVSNLHVVIGSTVLPGYIAETGRHLMDDALMRNCSLSYSPEFIAQGSIVHGTYYPDMLLIGEGSQDAGDAIERFHHAICKNTPKICRMSPESAEITKLSVNCFITTKVAFANMIGDIAERTPGANHQDILQAIGSDSRIGTKYLGYGFGFGGPCFPRDNRALGYYAKSIGVEPTIPEATDKSNKQHADYQAESIYLDIKKRNLIFGETHPYSTTAAYKENCQVPIIEESQRLRVAEILSRKYNQSVVIRDIPSIVDMVENEYGTIFEYQRM